LRCTVTLFVASPFPEVTLDSTDPDVVVAFDGDTAGERALWKLIDRTYPKPAPLRAQPSWELEAQIEHWSRLAVVCDGAGPFFALCRDAIRECDLELERRAKLDRVRTASNPYDWPGVLARVHERCDLLAVFGGRRPDCVYGRSIRRSGRVTLIRCPFHGSDRDPSLAVYDDNHWYCYGCGQGGDAIDAVQKLDGLQWLEAVERLGVEFNFELPRPGHSRDKANIVPGAADGWRRIGP
jgi:hypothetical protein